MGVTKENPTKQYKTHAQAHLSSQRAILQRRLCEGPETNDWHHRGHAERLQLGDKAKVPEERPRYMKWRSLTMTAG